MFVLMTCWERQENGSWGATGNWDLLETTIFTREEAEYELEEILNELEDDCKNDDVCRSREELAKGYKVAELTFI